MRRKDMGENVASSEGIARLAALPIASYVTIILNTATAGTEKNASTSMNVQTEQYVNIIDGTATAGMGICVSTGIRSKCDGTCPAPHIDKDRTELGEV